MSAALARIPAPFPVPQEICRGNAHPVAHWRQATYQGKPVMRCGLCGAFVGYVIDRPRKEQQPPLDVDPPRELAWTDRGEG